jgi:hypothetical protein
MRRLVPTLAVAAIAATLLSEPTSIATGASATAPTACELISPGQIRSILGLGNVLIQRDIPGTSSRDNIAGVTHSACLGVAWSGAPPTSPAATRQALASGRGAAFAIETWTPDDESKYVARWTDKGFDTLTGAALLGSLSWLGLPAFKPLHPHSLKAGAGANATGITATPIGIPGVLAAGGVWWNESSYRVVWVAIEESSAQPVVKRLNRIAKIAAPHFGVKAIQLS